MLSNLNPSQVQTKSPRKELELTSTIIEQEQRYKSELFFLRFLN